MRLNVKGINCVPRKLADGTKRYYYYTARKGGTLFWRESGRKADTQSAAFFNAYKSAIEQERGAPRGSFGELIDEYRAYVIESNNLRQSTKDTYLRDLDAVTAKWAKLPKDYFNDARIRGKIRTWRDSMGHMARTADGRVGALNRVCQHAYDGGALKANHASKIPNIHKPVVDKEPWTVDEIVRYKSDASAHLKWHIDLARLSGLRRGDLIALPLSADKGDRLEWKTSKRGKVVVIPIVPELRAVLNEIKRYRFEQGVTCTTILFSSLHRPWNKHGLNSSTGRQRAKHDIKRTMHRLRGNCVLTLCQARFSNEEVSIIVGWSVDDVAALRRIYIDQNAIIRSQIARLSEHKMQNGLQNGSET